MPSKKTTTNTSETTNFRRLRLVEDHQIGLEGRAVPADHQAVKLWLRLLSCSTQIEQEIRSRLRLRFDTTLPRFDYLAQLERHPEGLRMNVLSKYLMVTGGNVTGLTDQLVGEGWVERVVNEADRRSQIVRLTPAGREHFLVMAKEHERWLIELFAGFAPEHRNGLYELLGRLRVALVQATHPADPDTPEDPPTTSSSPSTARKKAS
jgi:DNA-binding MarR family transcriptional regulator